MSTPFNPTQGPIVVEAEVEGPTGTALLRVAVDTGATTTLLSETHLIAVGYDPAASPTQVRITTTSGVISVASIPLTRLRALNQERTNFPVLAHNLPPSAGVDGVLGLDFMRGHVLTIDFKTGRITLL
jgi:predicted aspartyl protease